MFSIRNIYFTVLLASLFCVTGLCATNKVFTIDRPVGIVADDSEWTCMMYANGNAPLNIDNGPKYITGQSKEHPLSFTFFYGDLHPGNLYPASCIKFLSNYANETDTVFSSVSFTEISRRVFVGNLFEGAYFDNKSFGYFAIYATTQKLGAPYLMFVKLAGDYPDEAFRTKLFEKAFELVTPLVSLMD